MQTDLLIDRSDIRRARIAQTDLPVAGDGQILVAVHRFALTTNNVTYAVFGDAMGYWKFFPSAQRPDHDGRLPVWGFADVIASQHDAVPVGERVFGYFPAATHLVLTPDKVTDAQWLDATIHRRALPGAYNAYRRVAADPGFVPGTEAVHMLFWPLFITSWLIDDFLADNNDFGAEQVLISSASAKTAIGLAWALRQRAGKRPHVIGLTSPGNCEFVTSLGCYDRVAVYDDVAFLPGAATVYVDIAGNAELRARVHAHWADALTYSCAVGGAHWDQQRGSTPNAALPGAQPTLFFAPAQVKKRGADWGPGEVERRLADAWRAFAPWTQAWHRVDEATGADAVLERYNTLVAGDVDPRAGHILGWE